MSEAYLKGQADYNVGLHVSLRNISIQATIIAGLWTRTQTTPIA